jgi:hypothetical protein
MGLLCIGTKPLILNIYIMKKTILKNAMFAALVVAGLSFTSCKDKNTETNSDSSETTTTTEGSSMDEGSGAGTGSDMNSGTAEPLQTETPAEAARQTELTAAQDLLQEPAEPVQEQVLLPAEAPDQDQALIQEVHVKS